MMGEGRRGSGPQREPLETSYDIVPGQYPPEPVEECVPPPRRRRKRMLLIIVALAIALAVSWDLILLAVTAPSSP